ncbi:unnamed protein product [Diatraea saccharalis]|uniref:C2H2-type domain-containing protein n=1 Tax=Diatraea saccharalis TaxID=40085 RepID=A0A9N9R6D7_9NEOP|nr:unnamed protein product [Diatraea saccharalis]
MNDETEIDSKIEFDVTLQCPGCLSFGRKMLAIDKYSRVFAKLISDISFHVPSEETLLCWECHSFVLRVARFQNRVWRANNLLLNGQNKIYSTLSCLATVIIPDTTPNTIYINESNVTVKEEGDKISYSENEELDTAYPEYSNDYEDPVSDMAVGKQTVKGETVDINTRKVNNKWAKKRAVQNRKAKFKLLHVKNINIYSVMKLSVANNVPDLNYKCAECNLEFNRENIMLKHFESNHKDRFVCDVCHKLLYNKTELLTHLVKHAKSYKCKFCEFSCDSESEGRKHIMKTHPQVLQCVKCELLFTCRRDFLEHYKEWHEKFICDYCGVSFKMRYCIKDHIRKQHSPFVCVPCNKRFTRYNGLWFHNKVRHGPPTDAAYCVECDKKYPDVYRYKWHLANSVRHKPRKKIE